MVWFMRLAWTELKQCLPTDGFIDSDKVEMSSHSSTHACCDLTKRIILI